jgi:hypothetical protein
MDFTCSYREGRGQEGRFFDELSAEGQMKLRIVIKDAFVA